MKRRMIAACVAAMLLVLAGCSGAPAENTTETGRTPQTHPATEALPKFRETTLVDNESCLFEVVDIDPEGRMGYTLQVKLENRTQENLMFSLNNVSVNGYMCDPLWAATVNAGMKANEKISFSKTELERSAITEVTDIAFTLSVYNGDDWMQPRLVEDTFSVYPHGEELAKDYPRTAQPGDIVLFDNEQCTMIVTGFDPENMWGYTVNVYLENKTEKNLMFTVSDAAVNALMCDPYWATVVAAGKKSNTAISWLKEDFSVNGINRVERLTLPVRVYDSDDISAENLVEQTFELTP